MGNNIHKALTFLTDSGERFRHPLRSSKKAARLVRQYPVFFISDERLAEFGKKHALKNGTGRPLRISVIVTSYHHEKYIADALESVLSQARCFDMEIIVSNDGSRDGTPEIIRTFEKAYPSLIQNISSTRNRGISENMYHCLKACTGDLIAVCEGDDIWGNLFSLYKRARFLQRHPECSMVSCGMVINLQETKELIAHESPLRGTRLGPLAAVHNQFASFTNSMWRAEWIAKLPPSLFYHRLTEMSVGGFCITHGPAGYIPSRMNLYRRHNEGAWSGLSEIGRAREGFMAYSLILPLFEEKDIADDVINHLNNYKQEIVNLWQKESPEKDAAWLARHKIPEELLIAALENDWAGMKSFMVGRQVSFIGNNV